MMYRRAPKRRDAEPLHPGVCPAPRDSSADGPPGIGGRRRVVGKEVEDSKQVEAVAGGGVALGENQVTS